MRSLIALSLAFATSLAQAACSFAPVEARFARMLVDESLPGGALLFGSRDGILLERYFGTYTPATVVPVASATKLLSGVRVAQLIERGVLVPDAPVSATLPLFTGAKGTMTLRQMFSHTAGYGDDEDAPVLGIARPSLAAAVDEIACCIAQPDGWSPGAQFAYGGIAMHVAGRVAEVATAKDWQQGWIDAVGAPLGTTTIDWQGLGPTTNYRIAGGARANLRDYARVLAMLAKDGVGANGRRVLGPAALASLSADNVGALPVAYAPPAAPTPVRYAMGSWIEPATEDASRPLLSSPGAFGFFPWVDRARGVYGVHMIRGQPGRGDVLRPVHEQIMLDARGIVAAGGCTPVEPADALFVDAFEAPP